ncbi:MAG TPA: aminotransferase class V-fold PLP-dependent enzyme, partial [Longimicrobiales bacterium]|nr:aminotransferase class V-fold PLP-dependent enzyme [Longimicrobiales bacterium]
MQRREFIKSSALMAAAPTFAGRSLLQEDWAKVREQFLIAPDRIYLNVGTLGAQPRPVVDAVIEATRKTAETFPPGVKWDEINKAFAALVDCDADGLTFPRNTTEAMNFVANGLDIVAGDHIVTTNHEHIGGLCCWQLVSKRRNAPLTQVDIGKAPQDPELVFKQIVGAVT